ncbi:hypothetical protein SLA2020_279850 [Shorea laevis]
MLKMKFGVFLITAGFGFDRRSNDFKVLRICNVVCNNYNRRGYYGGDVGSNLRKKGSKRQVEVYSMSTGKWRLLDLRVPFDELYLRGPIDPVPYFPTTASDGVFFWWVLPTKHYDKEELLLLTSATSCSERRRFRMVHIFQITLRLTLQY